MPPVAAPQQGWPVAPQATQLACPPVPVAVWHAKPPEQVAADPVTGFAQQGWLAPPHDTQLAVPPDVGVWHRVFGAVQRLFTQHGSPRAPQLPHSPAEQV